MSAICGARATLIEQAVRDVTIERIERAKPAEAGVGAAEILAHLPPDAVRRDDEGIVDTSREFDAPGLVFRRVSSEHRERIHPHRKIVKILAAAVGGLADADAAGAAKHALDFSDE